MELYERDGELVALSRAVAAAAGGTGAGVAITGEPGAGKSALVEVACARATGLRVLRGGCDPLVTPRPLGPFRDLIPGLRPADLHDAPAACEAAFAALRTAPTVLVVEDAHWIDGASVEVLRFLVRRLEVMPCALLVTYRDEEIGAQHQLRPLLGDFAKVDGLSTLRLHPLTADGVAMLLRGSGLDATQVHPLTGGNPFFVAEVAKEPDRPLPAAARHGPRRRPRSHRRDRRRRPGGPAARGHRPGPAGRPGAADAGRGPADAAAAARHRAAAARPAGPGVPARTGPARGGEHRPGRRRGPPARAAARGAGAHRTTRPGRAHPPRGRRRRRAPRGPLRAGRGRRGGPGRRPHRRGGVPGDRGGQPARRPARRTRPGPDPARL